MAKKLLSYADLVTGANAETLRAALEARIKIDEMLIAREEAYQQIAALEAQINEVVGSDAFEFDEPEVNIAWGGRSPKKKAAPKKTPIVTAIEPVDESSDSKDEKKVKDAKNEAEAEELSYVDDETDETQD
jgi:hypothetical protein